MSFKSALKKLNLGKVFGYSIAAGGTALALLNTFRVASGDLAASASLAENFLNHAGAIAGGIGFAQASGVVAKRNEKQNRPQLILPRRSLIIA